eukprot:GFUD01021304.1.p1 GENE.GFUD01021304.1~~GFUD01021304.1.p1  ORF type:complete len:467 (+),score=118.80 GFUD01021304.1:51-1451(+)
MASCAPDNYYAKERLCEITQCSDKQAGKLLAESNNDLMFAVEKFYSEDLLLDQGGDGLKVDRAVRHGKESESGRSQTDVNKNNVKVRKQRYTVPKVDGPQKTEDAIITSRPKLKKKSVKISPDNQIMFEDIDAEEDLVQEAIAISLAEAHPGLDPSYLRTLVGHFKGRQEKLHQYLETQIQNSDKFTHLRLDLLSYLQELTLADVEGVEMMVLEDCPKCSAPQLIPDKTVRLFQCREGCPGEFCRECRVYHEPVTCEGWNGGVVGHRNFCRVTKLEDKLGLEYQIVEEEFLSLMRENWNLLRIDKVENRKLTEKFERKKLNFRAEGVSDMPVLLFHATDMVDVEDVLENNFQLSLVNIDNGHTIGVHFTKCPKVDMSTKEQSCLIMCQVLEGHNSSGVQDSSSLVVPDVDQILPKYVVHFTSEVRKVGLQPEQAGQDMILPYTIVPVLSPRVVGDSMQTSSSTERN